ncbi:MAG: alpha/beta fold hydrolase [Rhodospirillaceae bacterium]|nr:alpha/beta fold hydrolase [Rhodospirillaceae bacterium]
MSRIVKAYAGTRQGQMHYRHVPGNGTPLVMYHRAPATSASFTAMMDLMTGDRPLYAFDMPGFGESFAPMSQPTAADYARWLLEGLDALSLHKAHIFAHHTGTHFATQMAADNPGRVASLMLNGIAYLTPEERATYAKTVQPPATPDAEGVYMSNGFKLIATLLPHFEARLYHDEMTAMMQSHWTRHYSFAAVWGQDYPAVFKRVTCPVLATCAENEMWRFCFDRVFVDKPEAKRVLLGPAKFYTPELDAPATVAAVRAFLREVEA